MGNGTTGPYTLSWKNTLPGTESVTVNDVPVIWGVDYTLDPTNGTLTFTHPLPAQAGATIQYGYDTAQAQPQGGGLNLPLALALNNNVSLVGRTIMPPTDGQKPGALNLGLNGGWQGANDGKLATHLLFVPAMTGADAQAAPNGLDRLGFDASGQTRLGKPLEVSFGFSRAGQGVGSAGSDNWQAGVQKMTLNAALPHAPDTGDVRLRPDGCGERPGTGSVPDRRRAGPRRPATRCSSRPASRRLRAAAAAPSRR